MKSENIKNIESIGNRNYIRDENGCLRNVEKYNKKLKDELKQYKEKIQKIVKGT